MAGLEKIRSFLNPMLCCGGTNDLRLCPRPPHHNIVLQTDQLFFDLAAIPLRRFSSRPSQK